jgi:hypothetical protein
MILINSNGKTATVSQREMIRRLTFAESELIDKGNS